MVHFFCAALKQVLNKKNILFDDFIFFQNEGHDFHSFLVQDETLHSFC